MGACANDITEFVELVLKAAKTGEQQPFTKCDRCGRVTSWINLHSPSRFMCSSSHLEDWGICRDCMTDHCAGTGCMVCEYLPSDMDPEECQFRWLKPVKEDED